MNHTPTILALADAGESPSAISRAVPCSLGYVYGVLRANRAGRARAKRTRTSEVPRKVVGLAAAGIGVDRIAVLLQISKAYAYRILAEQSV